MAPASLTLTLFEPVVYLRGQSAVGEDARGRRRPINFDAPPSQLRGLVTLTLPKPSRIKEVSISLVGKARTDWPEGIGPARLDTSEETTIIKQHVTLFSASNRHDGVGGGANGAAAAGGGGGGGAHEPPRRRAGSIGPGVVGLDDDGVDWAALQGTSSSAAPPSSSSSSSTPSAGAAGASSASTAATTAPATSDRRVANGEEMSPHRKSPALARQIGSVAARAGSAMLPPTLVREINTSKNNGISRSQSPPIRPGFQRSSSSGRSSSSNSRPTSAERSGGAGHPFGFGSAGTRSGPSTPAALPSSRMPYFYEDPPPRYQQAERALDAPATLQPGTPPLLSASAPSASSAPESVSEWTASTSSSSTSLSSPLVSTLSREQDASRAGQGEGQIAAAAPSSIGSARTQHPQSVSAAGPRGRSILHASGRQENRSKSKVAEGPGVRFDPKDVAAALCGNNGVNGSNATSQQSLPTSAGSPSPNSTAPQSAPSSTRTSMELLRSAAAPLTSSSPTRADKGKGKAKANGAPPASSAFSSSSASPSSSSPSSSSSSKPKKGGFKGLLGALLREEGDKDRESHHGAGAGDGAAEGHWSTTENDNAEWKEFKKGTYTYPISIPLPSNLPPTLHADFGSNTYMLKAHVHRAGALTTNLTTEREVTLIYAPDEDSPEETEAIVVERSWEEALGYIVIVGGKSFPVASKMTVWLKFVPTEKVRIHRIMATLEERTAYFARGRRVARHEVPRRWNMLKLVSPHANQPLLPIDSADSDALISSPLSSYAQHAADLYTRAADVDGSNLIASLADPIGPWELAADLEIPSCSDTRINISTNHAKSNIAVHHLIKLAIRVEKGGVSAGSNSNSAAGNRKLYDILIEAPVTITHSHTSHAWLNLPDYWSVRDGDEPASHDNQISTSRPRSSHSSAGSGSGGGASQAVKRATAPSLTPARLQPSSAASPPGASLSPAAAASLPGSSVPASSSSSSSSSSGPLPLPPGVGLRHLQGSRPASAAAARELSRRWLALSAGAFVGPPGSAGPSMSSYLNANAQVDPTGSSSSASSSASASASAAAAAAAAAARASATASSGAVVTVEEPPTYWQIDGARGSTDLDDDAREAVLAK